MSAATANILNNALMLSASLAMLYLLPDWWRLVGLFPLFAIVYHFGSKD